ncbi:MAG: NAD-dependent epimerase/dehydratase family protein [Victivallales bacterium]|nr:NAD-dependent epimerase/dehydratase family protein [Victivallales bacterium]
MVNGIILVTGSAGFIGFNLCRELLRRGYEVIGVDNFNDYYYTGLKEMRSAELHKSKSFIEKRINLCDMDALKKIFSSHKIGLVCNLAAQAGVRHSLTHPEVYEQSNLAAFLNILEVVRHNNIKRLVYASSSSVYGGNPNIPFSEDEDVNKPLSLYAATKRANELMAHCYTHLYGIQSIGLRFFSAYGPWGRPDMALWIFAESIKTGKPINVYNNGDMRRDFTYIDDIISGVCASLFNENLEQYEIFNLGNHRSEQLLHMISLIEQEMGQEAEKIMLPLQPGDVPESFANIDRAKNKLGFEPKTSIAAGIPAFIDWYKANDKLAREVIEWRRTQ